MISIHQVHAWLHYKLLCLRDYLILRDSDFETPGACLVTSCCVWEPLSKKGVVMRPRRANGQNAAFGSHQPSITCHVGRPCTHTIVLQSQIYTTLYHRTALCNSALQQVTILLKYALLYYTTIPLPYYSSILWHTFCLWARWEALSCGRDPFCSHAIMPHLSM